MEKTIKVDEHTYKLLNELVGEIRAEEKRPVSINKALFRLLKEKKKHNIMDFAGSWSMNEKEAKRMKYGLRKVWSKWKPKSF